MMVRLLLTLALGVRLFSVASADDWPQWMGPQRDNVWRELGIVETLPAGGPKVLWRVPVAGGYAGPAVANGKVYLFDYATGDDVKVANFERKEFTGSERLLCLDEATGKEVCRHEYPVKYNISYPAGPRCTPNIHDGKVYTLGAEGNLFCLDANTGAEIWSKDFNKDYSTKTALWGYTGHPLVDGQKLICIVGGEGSYAVAFDKNTGKELWRALTSPDQGYSPPTIREYGGKRLLVLLRPDAVTALDPETGKEQWSVPYQSTNGLVVMSPIIWHDYLFVGGYDKKNMLAKFAADGQSLEPIWADKNQQAISPINVQPAVEGDVVYGFDQSGKLCAMKLPDGDRLWDTTEPIGKRPSNSGTAFIVKQGGCYWMFTENGDLIQAHFTPAGYEELGRAHILDPTGDAFGRPVVWSAPAFANKCMFARNDKECVCVRLAAE